MTHANQPRPEFQTGETRVEHDFVLGAGVRIHGRVVDQQGDPVSSATIYAREVAMNNEEPG